MLLICSSCVFLKGMKKNMHCSLIMNQTTNPARRKWHKDDCGGVSVLILSVNLLGLVMIENTYIAIYINKDIYIYLHTHIHA